MATPGQGMTTSPRDAYVTVRVRLRNWWSPEDYETEADFQKTTREIVRAEGFAYIAVWPRDFEILKIERER